MDDVQSAPADPSIPALSQWRDELVARVCGAGFAAVPDVPLPQVRGYTFLERLGAGGMGEVWRVRHDALGRDVAIKFLRPGIDRTDERYTRFLREARLASAARDPGIVQVLHAGWTEDDQPFLVMEYIEGRSLRDVLRETGPRPWPWAGPIFIELARALSIAHRRGVVHRDLKPSNIMLAPTETNTLRPVVIDFGLARGIDLSFGVSLTNTDAVFGSPAYMSPEQFRGAQVDARADIYALGCILFEVLEGRRPFEASSPAELMYQHLDAPLPALRHVDATQAQRADLTRLLNRACAKDPAARPASMISMRDALEEIGTRRARRVERPRAFVLLASTLAVLGSLAWPSDEPRPAALADAGPSTSRPSAPSIEASAPLAAQPPRVRSIHAGPRYTCSVSDVGSVRCWGRAGPHFGAIEHPGNIGDDERPVDAPPLDFEGHAVVSLAMSYWSTHICAILDDGSVRCWGDNGHGQLGHGADTGDYGDSPGETPGRAPALAIADVEQMYTQAGWSCALTRRLDATREARCWGQNGLGQLGQGHLDQLATPPSDAIDLGGAEPVSLSLGLYHGCAVLSDGRARCWGSNGKHQLGAGLPTSVNVGDGIDAGLSTARPNAASLDIALPIEDRVAEVRANGGWSCLLTTRGKARCWGENTRGTLGYHHSQLENCPGEGLGSCAQPLANIDVDLGDLDGATLVDLQQGRQRACTLDSKGRVRCWGHASVGALGYGPALSDATSVAFVGHIDRPRDVYDAMGNEGVVDIGDFDGDGEIDPASQLSVGYDHACVIARDETVRCWGGNRHGQLGYATLDNIGDDETPGEYYASHGLGGVEIWAPAPR